MGRGPRWLPSFFCSEKPEARGFRKDPEDWPSASLKEDCVLGPMCEGKVLPSTFRKISDDQRFAKISVDFDRHPVLSRRFWKSRALSQTDRVHPAWQERRLLCSEGGQVRGLIHGVFLCFPTKKAKKILRQGFSALGRYRSPSGGSLHPMRALETPLFTEGRNALSFLLAVTNEYPYPSALWRSRQTL